MRLCRCISWFHVVERASRIDDDSRGFVSVGLEFLQVVCYQLVLGENRTCGGYFGDSLARKYVPRKWVI